MNQQGILSCCGYYAKVKQIVFGLNITCSCNKDKCYLLIIVNNQMNSMKKTTLILLALPLIMLVSCQSSNKEKQPEENNTMASDSLPPTDIKPNYSGLQFASNRDTTCSMPLSAGVSDTLLLGGKIYGFCAKECKDEFEKILIAEHKRWKKVCPVFG